ncbi:MAG: hypothetical protein AAF598_09635, partial [Bacteroidota bacterium]
MKSFYGFFALPVALLALFLSLSEITLAQNAGEPKPDGTVFNPEADPTLKIPRWYEFVQTNRQKLAQQHLQFVDARFQNTLDLQKILDDSLMHKLYKSQTINQEKWTSYTEKVTNPAFSQAKKAVDRVLYKWKNEIQGLDIDLQKWKKNQFIDRTAYSLKTNGLKQRISSINLESTKFRDGNYIVRSDREKQQNSQIDLSKNESNQKKSTAKFVTSEYRFYQSRLQQIKQDLLDNPQDSAQIEQLSIQTLAIKDRLPELEDLKEPNRSFVKELREKSLTVFFLLGAGDLVLESKSYQLVYYLENTDSKKINEWLSHWETSKGRKEFKAPTICHTEVHGYESEVPEAFLTAPVEISPNHRLPPGY